MAFWVKIPTNYAKPRLDGAPRSVVRHGRAIERAAGTRIVVGAVAALAASGVVVETAQAVGDHLIKQQNRSFSQRRLTVDRGDVVSFTNDDEFIHHVFVKSDAFNFDSGEQDIGQTIRITFSRDGTFDVLCAIHPKMRLIVTVK
jgi:plastocyanin